ncbi:hypothetical protein WDZ92_39245 [Nostoc sp. NIES-2111]
MVTEEMVRRRLIPLVQDGVLRISEIKIATSSMGRTIVQVSIDKGATFNLSMEQINDALQRAVSDLDVTLIAL